MFPHDWVDGMGMGLMFNSLVRKERIKKLKDFKEPTGFKKDEGKPRWDLLPWEPVEDVVKVITWSLGKYPENNWQSLPGYRKRFFAACMRHLLAAIVMGEKNDDESGLPHLAHAVCCVIYIMANDNTNKGVKND